MKILRVLVFITDRQTDRHTDRQTDRQMDRDIHSLCVGWRNLPTLRLGWRKFFSSCVVVSVFGYGGK
jgi:hypothetical protein